MSLERDAPQKPRKLSIPAQFSKSELDLPAIFTKKYQESEIREFFLDAIKDIRRQVTTIATHSIEAAAISAFALASKLKALQKAKKIFKKRTIEIDGLDLSQRENILNEVDTELAPYQEHFASLKLLLTNMLKVREPASEAFEKEPSTQFLSSLDFVYLNLRHIIGFDDKKAKLAFETLWFDLIKYSSTVFKGNLTNPQKNKMLQCVPALYRLAGYILSQPIFDASFVKVQASNRQLESIVAEEEVVTAATTKVGKRLRYCIKLGELYETYEKLENQETELNALIRNRGNKIAEVKTDDLDEKLRQLIDSKKRLLQEIDEKDGGPLSDYIFDHAKEQDINVVGNDVAMLDYICDEFQVIENEFQLESQNIERAMQVIEKLQRNQNQYKFPTKEEIISAGIDLPFEFAQYWCAIVNELFSMQEELLESTLRLQQQTAAIKNKRQKNEAEISLRLQQSPETKETKNESQATAYAKSFLPSDNAIQLSEKAVNLLSGSSHSTLIAGPTLLERKLELTRKVNRLAKSPDEAIQRLKKRNEVLAGNQKRQPRKPSGKPLIASGVSLGAVLVASFCLAFTLSNPLGWGAGLVALGILGACAAFEISRRLFGIGCWLERRKILLQANKKPEYLQAALEEQDDKMTEQSSCIFQDTTQVIRERLIEEGMIVESVYPGMFISPSTLDPGIKRCAMLREVRTRDVSDQVFGYMQRGSKISHYRQMFVPAEIPPTSAEFEEVLVPASSLNISLF